VEVLVFRLSGYTGEMTDREGSERTGVRYVGPMLGGVRDLDYSRARERLRPDFETDFGGQEREEVEARRRLEGS
jgi:hypothetical protein